MAAANPTHRTAARGTGGLQNVGNTIGVITASPALILLIRVCRMCHRSGYTHLQVVHRQSHLANQKVCEENPIAFRLTATSCFQSWIASTFKHIKIVRYTIVFTRGALHPYALLCTRV